MSTSYREIIVKIASRVGNGGVLAGSDMAAVEANYNDLTLTAANFDSPSFHFSALKDSVLLAEEKVSGIIAAIKNHPLRSYLRGLSADIANRAALPVVDSASNPVIGVIGAVKDTTTNVILTEAGISEVERLIRLGAAIAKTPIYKFAIDGATIIHTRANVIIEVCQYNRTTQAAAIAAGNIFFPDTFDEILTCGGIAALYNGTEAPETAAQFIAYFDDACKRLEMGASQ